MKQYCRYCSCLVYGDGAYCSLHEKTMADEQAKRVNKCEDFDFNEIDAFDPEKLYKPRFKKKKNYKQQKLF